jgi:CheY-like chemotaxis protein
MKNSIALNLAPSVMLIDDDEFLRMLLNHSFKVLGLKEIVLARDGREALKLLAARPSPPDFLICDVYMPTMDGFEFLEYLERNRYGGKIILLSGASPEMLMVARDVALAGGLQVVAALQKPVSQNVLAEVMDLDGVHSTAMTFIPTQAVTSLRA